MRPIPILPSRPAIPCAVLIAAVCVATFVVAAASGAGDRSDGELRKVESSTARNAPPAPRASAPHMDHEPKHGGIFFMAPDQHHHLEGALEASGTFRIYLYDAHTRPISAAGYRAVMQMSPGDEKTGKLTLQRDRRNGTLWVRIPTMDRFPIDMTVWITFPARDGSPERTDLFSFSFDTSSESVISQH